jgi:glycosyltransferase involved in cell wall biosynthesis
VDEQIAGPGIRYRELARALARQFDITLATPNEGDKSGMPFRIWPYRRDRWDSLAPAAVRNEVIVACGDTVADFPALAELRIPLVIDGYDPHTLETLALWSREPKEVQLVRHQERLTILRRQCQVGDFFICASERQRDWWLGLLEQEGRINPHTYNADPSLRQLIDVVPYGLPSDPPRATRPQLRGVWPGIGSKDRILLWGGGLWEWLDPLTALRAVRLLADKGYEIRLVFPGTRHPNPSVPDMPLRTRSLALADELGLSGRHVFFGDWIPHEDWPAVLLEADIGLSLHPDTVEARLAFRSRVLDYIWAGLPMVVTGGDSTGELVTQYGLGKVVPPDDHEAVAAAVGWLLDKIDVRDSYRKQFEQARTSFTWERVCEPLQRFCEQPHFAADRIDGISPTRMGASSDQVSAYQAEIARLNRQVAGYERGRFIRLMRWIHNWRAKVGIG